jgi:tetratricopeptide (TPR) repeat protein
MLMILMPNNGTIAKSLALAIEKTENYTSAIEYFKISYEFDNSFDNVECLFRAGVCLTKIDKYEDATKLLTDFIDICSSNNLYNFDKQIKQANLLLKLKK